jgi:hypothetical protein
MFKEYSLLSKKALSTCNYYQYHEGVHYHQNQSYSAIYSLLGKGDELNQQHSRKQESILRHSQINRLRSLKVVTMNSRVSIRISYGMFCCTFKRSFLSTYSQNLPQILMTGWSRQDLIQANSQL